MHELRRVIDAIAEGLRKEGCYVVVSQSVDRPHIVLVHADFGFKAIYVQNVILSEFCQSGLIGCCEKQMYIKEMTVYANRPQPCSIRTFAQST
jgi:hypothetical protein